MKFRHTDTVPIAAAKAGFSTATAYRIEKDPRLPSQKKAPRGRRRPDPLARCLGQRDRADAEGGPGPARRSPSSRRSCGAIPSSAPASAARWSAASAPGGRCTARSRRSSSARSTSPAGWACPTSPTWPISASRSPAQPLDHRLYHFRLAFSGFEHAHVVLGGESLSRWPRACRTRCGRSAACPREHRSDSLSAAFRNLDRDARRT